MNISTRNGEMARSRITEDKHAGHLKAVRLLYGKWMYKCLRNTKQDSRFVELRWPLAERDHVTKNMLQEGCSYIRVVQVGRICWLTSNDKQTWIKEAHLDSHETVISPSRVSRRHLPHRPRIYRLVQLRKLKDQSFSRNHDDIFQYQRRSLPSNKLISLSW